MKDYNAVSIGGDHRTLRVDEVGEASRDTHGIVYFTIAEPHKDPLYLSRNNVKELIDQLQTAYDNTKPTPKLPKADAYKISDGSYIVELPHRPGYYINRSSMSVAIDDAKWFADQESEKVGYPLEDFIESYGNTFSCIWLKEVPTVVVEKVEGPPITL